MREAWEVLDQHRRLASYCDPDNFDLYITNDHFGNGVIQCIEMILKQLSTPLTKEFNFHQSWALVSALVHFLHHEVHDGIWMNVDDRYNRVGELTGLIGCAFLSTLNALERIDQLKPDSEFLDLGLVMALYLKFSMAASRSSICLEYKNNDTSVNWQQSILEYAAKFDIDLAEQDVPEIAELIASCESSGQSSGKATATRWNWLKTLVAYRDEHADGVSHRSNIGGFLRAYSIVEMNTNSVQKRSQYHINGKDPLAHIACRDLAVIASGKIPIEVDELVDRDYDCSSRVPLKPPQSRVRKTRVPPSMTSSTGHDVTITRSSGVPNPANPAVTITNGRHIQVNSPASITTTPSGTHIRGNGWDIEVRYGGRIAVNGRVVTD